MNTKIFEGFGRGRSLCVIAALLAVVALAGLPQSVIAAEETKPRIGIIGSGKVGGGIGKAWVRAGYEVMFSSRSLEHDQAIAAKLGANAYAGTSSEAAAFGDVVMFSVPYHALPKLGEQLAGHIKDKVVIDACNPFPSRDGEIAVWAKEKGAGVASRELLPGARIVRAFNAVGATRMASGFETPERIGMPIASDDDEAAKIASRLIRDMGFDPVLIGDLERGRYLVPYTSPLSGELSPDKIRKIASELE